MEMLRKKKEQVAAEGKDVRTLLKEAKLTQKQKVSCKQDAMKIFTTLHNSNQVWYHNSL